MKAVDLLDGFADDLDIVLRTHGVATYQEPADRFAPGRQTAVRMVPAPEAGLEGTIFERLSPGFERGEDILFRERVRVYSAYVPTDDEPHEEGEG